jgi:predicted DNA-binding transcriptional regulator AlpA
MSVPTIDSKPPRHHLDRRAASLITSTSGDLDDLLTTSETAHWLSLSTQWLEIGRCRGYGPPFVRVSPRCVRYRRRDVLAWLHQRTHARTSEYAGSEA